MVYGGVTSVLNLFQKNIFFSLLFYLYETLLDMLERHLDIIIGKLNGSKTFESMKICSRQG